MEFMAVTPELMITGLPSTITLSRPKNEWGELENINLEKMRSTLASAVLSTRKRVNVRYLARSEPAFRLAEGVNVTCGLTDQIILRKEYESNPKDFDQTPATLIISERKEDPITPLVFDWSYLSMLNEIIHIEDNKVVLKHEGGAPKVLQPLLVLQSVCGGGRVP